jgi:hypothetical protein
MGSGNEGRKDSLGRADVHGLALLTWVWALLALLVTPMLLAALVWQSADWGGGLSLVIPDPWKPEFTRTLALLSGGPLVIWTMGTLSLVAIWLAMSAKPICTARDAGRAAWLWPRGHREAGWEGASRLACVGATAAAILLVGIAASLLTLVSGSVPGAPDVAGFGEAELWLSLFSAAFVEEAIHRGVLLTLPVWLLMRAGSRGLERSTIWQGGLLERGWSLEAACVLLLSAALFASAHVPQYGGWKWWPTFFSGLALGWLALRAGLAASVLAHALVNVSVFHLAWMTAALPISAGSWCLLVSLFTVGLLWQVVPVALSIARWELANVRRDLFAPRKDDQISRAVPPEVAHGEE